MNNDKQYTVKDVAGILHKSEKTIRRLLNAGTLVGKKLADKTWLISQEALDAFINDKPVVEEAKPAVSEAVNKVTEDAEIATQERIIAQEKMAKDAATLGMTTEEFLLAKENLKKGQAELDKMVADGIQSGVALKEGELAVALEATEQEKEKAVKLGQKILPKYNKAMEVVGTLTATVKELREKLDIQEDEEIKAKDEVTLYTENFERGIRLLRNIANSPGVKVYNPSSTKWMSQRADALENGGSGDMVWGKMVFEACSKHILKVALYFDNQGDCEVVNWLFKMDDIMRKAIGLQEKIIEGEEIPVYEPSLREAPVSNSFKWINNLLGRRG